MAATGNLSPEARAWAIEAVMRHVQGRWFERNIREQASEAMAVHWARANCGNAGHASPSGHRYACWRSHIDVEYPDGSKGKLDWLDAVRTARADSTQLALF